MIENKYETEKQIALKSNRTLIFPNKWKTYEEMEYLLANIIFMFFHGLFISCLYASDYVTLLNMTWTRD